LTICTLYGTVRVKVVAGANHANARQSQKIPATFYRTANGAEPVRDWLLKLDPADRKIIGVDIAVVEYGWPDGMPTCRPLG